LADSNKRDAPGGNAKLSAPMGVDDFLLAGRPFDMETDGAIKNFGSGNTLQGKAICTTRCPKRRDSSCSNDEIKAPSSSTPAIPCTDKSVRNA